MEEQVESHCARSHEDRWYTDRRNDAMQCKRSKVHSVHGCVQKIVETGAGRRAQWLRQSPHKLLTQHKQTIPTSIRYYVRHIKSWGVHIRVSARGSPTGRWAIVNCPLSTVFRARDYYICALPLMNNFVHFSSINKENCQLSQFKFLEIISSFMLFSRKRERVKQFF